MSDRTYLDIAKENLILAKNIYVSFDDEIMLNYAGYHLQQSVELTLKYILFMNGIDFPKVHSINQLINVFEKNDMLDLIPEYIDDNSDMITNWESQTRYILDYQIARRKIVKAFPEIENLISNVEEMYKEYVNEFEEDEQENNLEI